MYTYALLFALLTLAGCEERPHKTQYVDPFSMMDRHITHSLAYHYLWPWSQLIRAAAALDIEESLEDPQIMSDSEKYQVNLKVKRFKPEELKIKVKNRYIVVEGKHKQTENEKKFMANHFVQRFVMPPGAEQDEVKAVLNENGVLSITVPKHEVPPPLPEREVPIEVVDKRLEEETKTTAAPVIQTTTRKQIDWEASGKVRRKDLKPKAKGNEVVDDDGVVDEYALYVSNE